MNDKDVIIRVPIKSGRETLQETVIANAVRWHYYDVERGEHSADPARNGMNWGILEQLEVLLHPRYIDCLKIQAHHWAEYELGKQKGELLWDDVPRPSEHRPGNHIFSNDGVCECGHKTSDDPELCTVYRS